MKTASIAARTIIAAGLWLQFAPAHSEEPALPNTLDSSAAELKSFFSSSSLAAIQQPEFVEAFEVKMDGWGLSAKPVISTEAVRVDPQNAKRFSRALLRVDSYMLNAESACMFEPGIALRFHKATAVIEALICFKCGEVLFKGTDDKWMSERLKLSSGKKRLLVIAKKVFPKNKEPQDIE